jgi:glycerol-3-phosphate O-acyltransferase
MMQDGVASDKRVRREQPARERRLTQIISVPLWLFAILALLAMWAALVLLLAPGLRWFFRRRVNQVIGELNTRLNVDIPSFKLTRRQVLIDRLFHDPKVQAAVDAYCEEAEVGRSVALRKVDRYAHEIVPSFNAYLYFRVGYAIARAVARTMYRVRLGYADDRGYVNVDRKSTIVFVMNHRSNMDYVLVAFLAAERAALSYAVGEWARIWPLQQLIRSMGAYFVRRNSGDHLYRTVLQRYVQMATEAGVCQAVFPEGGLSLDGKLRAPKFGLLDYMVRTFNPHGERDLVFIPVGINYDRVLEDRTLLRKLDPQAAPHGPLQAAAGTTRFVAKNLGLWFTRRWFRFGYACVNFGSPLSMRHYAAARDIDFRQLSETGRRDEVTRLGQLLMTRIGEVIPVLPVSLVARVVLQAAPAPLSELELKARALSQLVALEQRGARIYVPREDLDYAIGVGLRMLTLRRLITETDGLFVARVGELPLLGYYANAIGHHLDARPQPAPQAAPAPSGASASRSSSAI